MTFRVIARTRYDDRTSDVVQDFPTEQEARDYLAGLGFQKTESIGWVDHYGKPIPDSRDPSKTILLAGYLVRAP